MWGRILNTSLVFFYCYCFLGFSPYLLCVCVLLLLLLFSLVGGLGRECWEGRDGKGVLGRGVADVNIRGGDWSFRCTGQ